MLLTRKAASEVGLLSSRKRMLGSSKERQRNKAMKTFMLADSERHSPGVREGQCDCLYADPRTTCDLNAMQDNP